jgi:hypothetical protein
MALIDKQALLSDEQAVTATAFGQFWYDTGTQARNIGRIGERLKFTVDEAATAAGAATVTFEVGDATDDSGTGFTVLASSAAIGKAALTLGASPFDVALPDNTQRYIGVRFTVATGPLTAGKFSAFFTGEGGSGHQRAYTSGYPNPYA